MVYIYGAYNIWVLRYSRREPDQHRKYLLSNNNHPCHIHEASCHRESCKAFLEFQNLCALPTLSPRQVSRLEAAKMSINRSVS